MVNKGPVIGWFVKQICLRSSISRHTCAVCYFTQNDVECLLIKIVYLSGFVKSCHVKRVGEMFKRSLSTSYDISSVDS